MTTTREVAESFRRKGIILGKENTHIIHHIASFLNESKVNKKPLKNVLFIGARGTGKTTLLKLYSEYAPEVSWKIGSGITKPIILYEIGTVSGSYKMIAIDEVHTISPSSGAAEKLGEVMLDEDLPISVCAATMRPDKMPDFLRQRFFNIRINPYSVATLSEIAKMYYDDLTEEAAYFLASTCDNTPRDLILNRISGFRSHAIMREIEGGITIDHVIDYYKEVGIDRYGLETIERRYMSELARAEGNTLGLSSLAHKLGLPEREVEDIIENKLIRLGLIARKSRGRTLTEEGVRYLTKLVKGEII